MRVRQPVVDALRVKPMTAKELAEELGIEYMTAKNCVWAMEKVGLVDSSMTRPVKRGSPSIVYRLIESKPEVLADFLAYKKKQATRKPRGNHANKLNHMEAHDPSIEQLLRSKRMQPCLTSSPN